MGYSRALHYACAFAAVVGLSTPAAADDAAPGLGTSGNALLAACEGGGVKEFACLIYINGVLDGANGESERRSHAGTYCPSATVTYQQQRDVVVKWLHDHPTLRDVPSSLLIITAARQAFPCRAAE